MKPKASNNNVGLKLKHTVHLSSYHFPPSHTQRYPSLSSFTSSSYLEQQHFFLCPLPALTNLQHVSRRWHYPLCHWLWPWHPRARPCLRVRTVRQKKRTMTRVVKPSESSSLVLRPSSFVPRPSSHETLQQECPHDPTLFFSSKRSISIYIPLPFLPAFLPRFQSRIRPTIAILASLVLS